MSLLFWGQLRNHRTVVEAAVEGAQASEDAAQEAEWEELQTNPNCDNQGQAVNITSL